MNLKKILSTVAVASMLVACGGGSDSKTADAFKVGVSGPLSGDAAVYGNAVKNAAELAVEEVNAKGGVQIELNVQDDEANPEKSPNAYSTLKDWGMQIGLGTVTSGAGAAVSQSYADDQTFALTPSSSSPAVIYKDDAYTQSYGTVFQMCFTDPNQGLASADYMKTHKDLGSKIAVIYKDDDPYSRGIYQKFIDQAKKDGLNVVSEKSFTGNATDFSTQLQDAQKNGADLIFLPIYYQPASLILKKAKDMNYKPTFFGVDGMDGILTLEGFDKSLAEGVYLLTPFSADAYDCIYAIHTALTEGKATTDMSNADLAELLKKQFTTMKFDGITGTSVTWNENGEVSKSPKAVIIKDGVYVGVED